MHKPIKNANNKKHKATYMNIKAGLIKIDEWPLEVVTTVCTL
jgi:hypothetical protein